MGKSSKSNERRARIEQLERERKSAERKRLLVFGVIIGIVAAAIIGSTGWALWQRDKLDREAGNIAEANEITEIGAEEAAAECDPVEEKPATGGGQHVEQGKLPYDQAPPAYGPHRPNWAGFERKFYTAEDRPEVEQLVHNLEHGYNILWYDETIADDEDALINVMAISKEFEGSKRDPKDAFIAAPWTSEDGGAFPDGKHIALTHWWAEPNQQTKDKSDTIERGITRYCGQPSGEVVDSFMQNYPWNKAREPGAM